MRAYRVLPRASFAAKQTRLVIPQGALDRAAAAPWAPNLSGVFVAASRIPFVATVSPPGGGRFQQRLDFWRQGEKSLELLAAFAEKRKKQRRIGRASTLVVALYSDEKASILAMYGLKPP